MGRREGNGIASSAAFMNTRAEAQLSSDEAGDNGKRSLLRRLLDFVFGYDFFISYSWSDGAAYATALASRLEADGFEVFLDRASYASGDNWKKVGAWTLRRNRPIDIVGSPAAIRSGPVIREVRFSARLGAHCSNRFAGSLEWTESDSPLAPYLPAEILRIREPAVALHSGPSEETVATIRRTFGLVRQDKKRMRAFLIIALLLGVLAVAATLFAYYANFGKGRNAASENERVALKNESISLTALSDVALKGGYPVDAVKLALAAWPRKGDDRRPQMRRVITALVFALSEYHERVRIDGHSDPVRSAAFSSDGKRLITASEDKTAQIWDAETGEHLRTLNHDRNVWSAAFDLDGARVITASEDKKARIWDAKTGKLLVELQGHGGTVYSAAFSPDGARVVTASEDKKARIWDAKTGKVLTTVKHDEWVLSAVFSPDGSRIVTASEDNTARIWDAKTGQVPSPPVETSRSRQLRRVQQAGWRSHRHCLL